MAFRFLGNKTKLTAPILHEITASAPPDQYNRAVDLFCGTGSISFGFRQLGYRVTANDHLLSCVLHARAQLLTQGEPAFEGLLHHEGELLDVVRGSFLIDTTYGRVLSALSSLPITEGFFFSEYSPAGTPANGSAPRKYFTTANACRIDTIRQKVKEWAEKGWISDLEHAVLLHDLILAVNDVANIAGTYGYFLANWSKSALADLQLKPSVFSTASSDHVVIHGEARVTAKSVSADVYYLDPPYTKRQYAAYYHVLETLAHEDEPLLLGKSGLRPWEAQASDFCHKLRAPGAMKEILDAIDAKYVFVSYSQDGHITHEQMMELLQAHGEVSFLEIPYRRYISNGGTKDSAHKERLYRVRSR